MGVGSIFISRARRSSFFKTRVLLKSNFVLREAFKKWALQKIKNMLYYIEKGYTIS